MAGSVGTTVLKAIGLGVLVYFVSLAFVLWGLVLNTNTLILLAVGLVVLAFKGIAMLRFNDSIKHIG